MMQKLWRRFLVRTGFLQKPEYLGMEQSKHPSPSQVIPGRIIVVGWKTHKKWAYFKCPCQCGEIVQLPLMPDSRPHWTVFIDRYGYPTIQPSVRRNEGCYSHFWVRKGNVKWCEDTGRSSRV